MKYQVMAEVGKIRKSFIPRDTMEEAEKLLESLQELFLKMHKEKGTVLPKLWIRSWTPSN